MSITSCQIQRVDNSMVTRALRQRGISLVMVLICIAILSIAATGLVRMVDTGALVIGNVAFKQSTTAIADDAAEFAVQRLLSINVGNALLDDIPAEGYYATSVDELDPTGNNVSNNRAVVNWSGAPCQQPNARCLTPRTINGQNVQYVITRMCQTTGDPNGSGNSCARPMAAANAASTKRGELKYGEHARFTGAVPGPFFRILVRATGPRNTVSFTETYIYF